MLGLGSFVIWPQLVGLDGGALVGAVEEDRVLGSGAEDGLHARGPGGVAANLGEHPGAHVEGGALLGGHDGGGGVGVGGGGGLQLAPLPQRKNGELAAEGKIKTKPFVVFQM